MPALHPWAELTVMSLVQSPNKMAFLKAGKPFFWSANVNGLLRFAASRSTATVNNNRVG